MAKASAKGGSKTVQKASFKVALKGKASPKVVTKAKSAKGKKGC